jgi:hypothetical protein
VGCETAVFFTVVVALEVLLALGVAALFAVVFEVPELEAFFVP